MALAEKYYRKNPSNYIMGMLLAKTLLLNKKYCDAAAILDKIVVIPYEGATDGRRLYKEAHLMLCVDAMKNKNYKKAIAEITLARQWPERLGVGKPYDEDIDERLENFLLYQCFTKSGNKAKARNALEEIRHNKSAGFTTNSALTEWANGNTTALNNIPPDTTDENSRVFYEWIKLK